MKKMLLLAMFIFSAFLIGCGKSHERDCHHYYGSDWWDDPLYHCHKPKYKKYQEREYNNNSQYTTDNGRYQSTNK